MKRYFRREGESDLGAGTVYVEFTDNWPTRQVEVYGDTWRWGDEAHNQFLGDQPFEVHELTDDHAITADEFEQAWREAQARS